MEAVSGSGSGGSGGGLGAKGAAMHRSPRCGARTRRGGACRAPAVSGKRRCRMHGGAAGIGAPRGNRNARKHGFYSAAAKAERRRLRLLIKVCEADLNRLERGASGRLENF